MKITTRRLRTLTTDILHAPVSHVYEDIEALTGVPFMTHQLPNAMRALEPWLRQRVKRPEFWNKDVYEPNCWHKVYDIAPMTTAEQKEFFERYKVLPNPLAGKEVIVVVL